MSKAGDGDTFGRDETNYVESWDEFVRSGNYGDLHRDPNYYGKVKVFVPKYLSFSDYSGGTAERSNAKVWKSEFGDLEDEAWTSVPGGHGTSAVVILAEALTPEMEEFVSALSDYPVADEGVMSEMETEAQNEAWTNFYEREFVIKPPVVAAAQEEFPDADPDLVEEAVDEAIDRLDEQSSAEDFGTIFTMFSDAMEASNTYWEEQTGGDMYVDMKRVVDKGLDENLVLDYLLEHKLLDAAPLMSEDAAELWRARRDPRQTSLKFDGLRGRR